jgi:hypothetical protein
MSEESISLLYNITEFRATHYAQFRNSVCHNSTSRRSIDGLFHIATFRLALSQTLKQEAALNVVKHFSIPN